MDVLLKHRRIKFLAEITYTQPLALGSSQPQPSAWHATSGSQLAALGTLSPTPNKTPGTAFYTLASMIRLYCANQCWLLGSTEQTVYSACSEGSGSIRGSPLPPPPSLQQHRALPTVKQSIQVQPKDSHAQGDRSLISASVSNKWTLAHYQCPFTILSPATKPLG